MRTWKADTPGRVPAGARISAGKSGSVDRSLPNSAEVLVNCVPVSCMPSPESPAKRMTTSVIFSGATSRLSFSATVVLMVLSFPGITTRRAGNSIQAPRERAPYGDKGLHRSTILAEVGRLRPVPWGRSEDGSRLKPRREDVLGVEVFADRADLAVADRHQQVVLLIVDAAVVQLAQGLDLDRHLVALGDGAFHRQLQPVAEPAHHVVEEAGHLLLAVNACRGKLVRLAGDPPGGVVGHGFEGAGDVVGAEAGEEFGGQTLVVFGAHG